MPMIMLKSDNNYRRISLKIKPENLQETLKHVEDTWAAFDPVYPVEYRFLDDMFNEQYQQEERLSTMIKVFTIIAILIGCLGLIGMVGFIIETKLKEIGIRKVLGASTQSIVMLVSNRFLVLVSIAFLVALPLSYYLMSQWLENFVYRTSIGVFLIAMPFVLTLVLTLITTSYQTIKASLINPVECLKDE
jgi:putative ABC transport system permease protein